MKFGFVILHYMAEEMTTKCVTNLLNKFSGYDLHIIVVDNGSPNGSGHQLQMRYADEKRVTVLLSQENLGFARGNNLGYRYLLENDDPDFVIVMNNDVLIEQDDFLEQVVRLHEKKGYAVLGPDVFSVSHHIHQSPFAVSGITENRLAKTIAYYRQILQRPRYMYVEEHLRYFLIGVRPVYQVIHSVSSFVRKCRGGENTRLREKEKAEVWEEKERLKHFYQHEHENVPLYGACYIFSRAFTGVRRNCFCPDTFLYFEEEILHYECMRDHLKTVYSPALRVLHYEDVSTKQSSKTMYQRFLLKAREMEKSCCVLLDMMRRDKNQVE